MVRIKQFADDLGIPYNEAKKLVMAGRKERFYKDVLDKMRERANKRIQEFEDAAKKRPIANEDTNMVLKAKKAKPPLLLKAKPAVRNVS